MGYGEIQPRMKTLIAAITNVTMAGLIATACGSPTGPSVGSQGSEAQTGGGMPYPGVEPPVEGARIVLSDGPSPSADLVVSVRLPNDCREISRLRFNTLVYPWPYANIEHMPKYRSGECSDEPIMVEASRVLEGKEHLYEPCKTYLVQVNEKPITALATDSAADCPPGSAQTAPEDVLNLPTIDNVRLSHTTTETAPLLIADYTLTLSCIRPSRHELERDGDRLKVYILVTDINFENLPGPDGVYNRPCQQRTLEYRIPLEEFAAGETVTV